MDFSSEVHDNSGSGCASVLVVLVLVRGVVVPTQVEILHC